MKRSDDFVVPSTTATQIRYRIAQRVADAHRGIDDASLLCFVSGSVVENLADEKSDVDMSVVLAALPEAALLQQACSRAGGSPWFWTAGSLDEGGLVVAFHIDGIEVQIGYATHAVLRSQIDELLVAHNPDTPLHKLGEGILKAEALFGQRTLQALKDELAVFPPALALAMARHFVAAPTPWKALAQIVDRDAALWCREIEVEACYRLLGLLAALNSRYFTRFQVKRLHRFVASLAVAPAGFADRIEALLAAPPREAVLLLHALEGEVLALVGERMPEVDLEAALARHRKFDASAAAG